VVYICSSLLRLTVESHDLSQDEKKNYCRSKRSKLFKATTQNCPVILFSA
jgi:hypothetical protein